FDAGPDAAPDAAVGTLPDGKVPAVCLKPEGRCVRLLSLDCPTLTGDYTNDDAIVVGTLFSLSGTTGATNVARQQSATLAVEEINPALGGGGIPPAVVGGPHRPLVAVSCDEANLLRAAGHLVTELHVPAVVGPNTSQDALDMTLKVSAPGGTLLMTPTAVA